MTWIYTLKKKKNISPKNFSKLVVKTRMTQNKMEKKGLCAHELGCFLYYSWAPSTKEHVEPGRVYDICWVSI